MFEDKTLVCKDEGRGIILHLLFNLAERLPACLFYKIGLLGAGRYYLPVFLFVVIYIYFVYFPFRLCFIFQKK